MRRAFAALALAVLAFAPAHAADDKDAASPFIFAQSALAPAPSRGWVALLPGENELSFEKMQSHLEKTALLLNANGFDTLIVPFDAAYDEDIDGDSDDDGERIAAVAARAVRWMKNSHPDLADRQGALVAWGEGTQGLWPLIAAGGKYPLPDLVAAIAYHPGAGPDRGFDSRVPLLLQVGQLDEELHTLRHTGLIVGSVEPELSIFDDARRGFDIERFAKPKTVRSVPLISRPITFAYNAVAAHAAEQKMLTFLKARLEAPE